MTKKELEAKTPEELVSLAQDLDKQLAASKKETADANKTIEELNTTVDDMNLQIEELAQAKEDAKSGKEYVTVKKKKCLILTPKFKLNGKVYTAKDLQEDAALVNAVLDVEGQQIIKV